MKFVFVSNFVKRVGRLYPFSSLLKHCCWNAIPLDQNIECLPVWKMKTIILVLAIKDSVAQGIILNMTTSKMSVSNLNFQYWLNFQYNYISRFIAMFVNLLSFDIFHPNQTCLEFQLSFFIRLSINKYLCSVYLLSICISEIHVGNTYRKFQIF